MLPADTDDRIIAILMQDADLTYKEMAKKLKLNESTVRKRVLALRRKGIIRRFLADVDAVKLGYKSPAMLAVDVDPSKIMEIGRKLVKIPEARIVFSTSGENDFHVIVWAKDRESLTKVVSHVAGMEGVARVTPNFVVDKLK